MYNFPTKSTQFWNRTSKQITYDLIMQEFKM